MKLETIVGVGIIVDGKLYHLPKPKRHHHLIHLVYNETKRQVITESQGFMTSTGRYVDRKEGLIIAKKANQLLPCHEHPTELFSESVWESVMPATVKRDYKDKQYYKIYIEGYRARVEGLKRNENWYTPVRSNSIDEKAWFDGWDKADSDFGKKLPKIIRKLNETMSKIQGTNVLDPDLPSFLNKVEKNNG